MNIRGSTLLLVFVFAVLGQVVAAAPADLHDRAGLIKYNSNAAKTIRPGESLKFFIWNVAKYDDPKALLAVTHYAGLADFVMIEESMITGRWADFYKNLSAFNWYSGATLEWHPGEWTGVTTGTRFAVSDAFGIRSDAREPYYHSPKMIVITELPIEGRSDKLWVVNIHGINFVSTSKYQTQIDQLERYLSTHKGPILLAGDFNPWWVERALIIHRMAERIGLTYVPLHDDYRTTIPFDHIFTRGLATVATEYLNNQDGSDHQPMWGEFEVTP